MAKKDLSSLSSDELFDLARKRAEEEQAKARDAARARIEELRAQRRTLVAKHRKELAAIDSEIRKAGGRGKTRRKRSSNVTDQVLEVVGKSKELSTKEIKVALEQRGVVANNLSQTLAYLKRQGKVTSPSRSIYRIA